MSEKFYYMQNGYVGNAVAWWALDGKGYTTEIEKAHRFTESEAQLQVNCRPDDDKAWLCDHVDALESPARKTIIDGQYLESDFRLRQSE